MSQAREITRALDRFSGRAVVAITTGLTEGLFDDTPKRTGWAASNWVPTIGAPFAEARTENPDRAMVPSQRASQLRALGSVQANYRLSMGSTFVTDNVPYINRLNEGSSAQAPAAFVQARINRTLSSVDRSLRQ